MRRLHLFEIEDQPWCPRALRDGGTDWLRFMALRHKAFDAIAPKLTALMERTGARQFVDLCSGGGGSWLTLERALGGPEALSVRLTDLYPNSEALAFVARESAGALSIHGAPVDATAVPEELDGIRTIFSAFHHFKPRQAEAILADAVRKRRPIVVVEGSDHRLLGVLMVLLMPLAMLFLTPLMRPFRWSRLFLTYVLPAIPLLALIDGIASILRVYSPEELRELVARVPGHEGFDWDIGLQPVAGSPLGLTYLIGAPR